MTDEEGKYAFQSMPLGGIYEVIPNRDGDDFRGVSTADLVVIQRYLLGKQPINSPYKLIAADVNRSNSITAADISELRKFILGVHGEFPNNTSWRFVDEGYDFPEPQDPWMEEFPESYRIEPFERDMAIDFIGVKVGDVNGDVDVGGFDENKPRGERQLVMEDGKISEGNKYEVMLRMEDLSDIAGYQFTLEWKPEYLELEEIVPNLGIGMDLSNFGLTRLEEGVIATSWHKHGREVKEGEDRLFMLRFRGKKRGQMSEILTVSDQIASKECYVGESLEVEDIELRFMGGSESRYFALYQNEPNPWSDQTVIGFHLPEAQGARLTIFDENGREIKVIRGEFERGMNEVKVYKSELGTGGLMYYRLETQDHVATRKMIMIE